MLVYPGTRYCGLQGDNEDRPPLNAFDEACYIHDHMYGQTRDYFLSPPNLADELFASTIAKQGGYSKKLIAQYFQVKASASNHLRKVMASLQSNIGTSKRRKYAGKRVAYGKKYEAEQYMLMHKQPQSSWALVPHEGVKTPKRKRFWRSYIRRYGRRVGGMRRYGYTKRFGYKRRMYRARRSFRKRW